MGGRHADGGTQAFVCVIWIRSIVLFDLTDLVCLVHLILMDFRKVWTEHSVGFFHRLSYDGDGRAPLT